MQAGVPLYATPGPGGGHAIDPAHTLPPVNFTSDEAAALAIALARPGRSPLAEALRSALRKVLAAMPAAEAVAAQRLASRVHLMADDKDASPQAARTLEQSGVAGRVGEIEYKDKDGAVTHRAVEPLALVGASDAWYLMAHCRLRDDMRFFRLDRVATAELTGEPAPERDYKVPEIPTQRVRRLSLLSDE